MARKLIITIACFFMSQAFALEAEVSGLIEAESSQYQLKTDTQKETSSDSYIATAELSGGLVFSEVSRLDIVLLAEDIGITEREDYRPTPGATEDRPDRLHVEEAIYTHTVHQFEFSVGQFTLPFGVYETTVLSDPQTLELGEALAKNAFGIDWLGNGYHIGITGFQGKPRTTEEEQSGYTVNAEWDVANRWVIGGGYLSHQGIAVDAPALYNFHANASYGAWTLLAEYVAATEKKDNLQPATISADIGYNFADAWQFGLRYNTTDDFSVIDGGDGKYQEWVVAASYTPADWFQIGIEFLQGTESDYDQEQFLTRVALAF